MTDSVANSRRLRRNRTGPVKLSDSSPKSSFPISTLFTLLQRRTQSDRLCWPSTCCRLSPTGRSDWCCQQLSRHPDSRKKHQNEDNLWAFVLRFHDEEKNDYEIKPVARLVLGRNTKNESTLELLFWVFMKKKMMTKESHPDTWKTIDTGDHGGCWYGHSKETPIRLWARQRDSHKSGPQSW